MHQGYRHVNNQQLISLPVICGPTASGKSRLASILAQKIDGEIISCDSMQIYKGMNIGTAKPSIDDQTYVIHHMIDVLDPRESYSVAQFKDAAEKCIVDCLNRNKVPILCGGTGQYIDALIKGVSFVNISTDKAMREKLANRAKIEGADVLYESLCSIDAEAAKKIHPHNLRRVIRALEIYYVTGQTMSEHNAASKEKGPSYSYKVFGIKVPRDELYQHIEQRVDHMIDAGLEKEAYDIYTLVRDPSVNALQAIGYKEWIDYFEGRMSREEAIATIKKRTRNYAKRQMTWFRSIKDLIWIDPDDISVIKDAIFL